LSVKVAVIEVSGAIRGAAVAGANEDRCAFRGGGLERRFESDVRRLDVEGFA
jgi:hypothetical protein